MAQQHIQLTDADMREIQTLLHGGPRVSAKALAGYYERRGNPRVERYRQYMAAYDELRTSRDPSVVRARAKVNDHLKAMLTKDIAPGTVHQNSTLSNMSVQYANHAYIGEALMPVLPVGKETDTYYTYGQSDRMQYPNDALGDRGQANEIQETRGTATYTCLPYGYSNFVASRTLNNQDAPLDEMVDLVDAINEGIAFRRELRIATVLTTAGNFGANTAAIAAANRWDTVTGGDPIADIQTAKAAIWQGRGPSVLKCYSSLGVYNVLSRHPAILDLFKYGGSSPGLATPDMVGRFFGIDSYLVAEAMQDATNEATAATYTRVWGDVFGIVRVSERASRRNAVFGYTIRHGQPITTVVFDSLKGHGGGFTAQVSVSETHPVVAAPTGYLLTTPIG